MWDSKIDAACMRGDLVAELVMGWRVRANVRYMGSTGLE